MTALPGSLKEEKPDNTEWLTQVSWHWVNVSQTLCFTSDGCIGKFCSNFVGWKAVFDVDHWPNNFKLKCTLLQKACLIFAIRTDATAQAIQDIIEEKLGRYFLEPPPLDLPTYYKDSAPNIPLIYVLAMGSDLMSDIQRLADECSIQAKINPISLDQGPKAVTGIKEDGQSGKGVLLQNCHLAPRFMATLENLVEKFNLVEGNPMFRLWLTAFPSPADCGGWGEDDHGNNMALFRSYLVIDEEWFESSSKLAEVMKTKKLTRREQEAVTKSWTGMKNQENDRMKTPKMRMKTRS